MRSRDQNDAHFHLRRRLLLGLAASPLLGALPGRAFAQTGSEPLEFMVFGIAKDMAAKARYMIAENSRPRGGRGAQ